MSNGRTTLFGVEIEPGLASQVAAVCQVAARVRPWRVRTLADLADDARRISDGGFRREVFSARLRHDMMKETHVIVGDHPPERRADEDIPRRYLDIWQANDPDICLSGDHSRVADCKGAACRAHKRCCWQ